MEMTIEEDIQQDDIFDRENLRRSLRFIYLKALQPAGATGTIATFDVAIPGLLKIKRCSLKRRTGEPIRLVTARLEQDGGFSVELRGWLRDAVLSGAVAAVRSKLEGELSALDMDAAKAEDVPPSSYVPGIDVAALPAQLMLAVRAGN
jgi:hypothetical protein